MGFDFSPLSILNVVFYLLVVLFSLSVHESAHAWAAWKLGDPTAKMLGRVTLNPLPHIDLWGTILVPAFLALSSAAVGSQPFIFGWAKPVPVIRRNFKNLRRDDALVAAAGPASNFVLAGLTTLILMITALLLGGPVFQNQVNEPYSPVWAIITFGITNLSLAVFNLLPVPPLDGSWIFSALLPRAVANFYEQIRPGGWMILLVLMVTGVANLLMGPAMWVFIRVFFVFPFRLLSLAVGA